MTTITGTKSGYRKAALVAALAAAAFGTGVDAASASQAKAADSAVADGPVRSQIHKAPASKLVPSEGSGNIADSEGVDTREKAFKDVAPALAPLPESILGADNRYRIYPTTCYPLPGDRAHHSPGSASAPAG